jgi:hypothetical protein
VTCHVDGCSRPIKGRGLCNTHHKHYRRKGWPMPCEPRQGTSPMLDARPLIDTVVATGQSVYRLWPDRSDVKAFHRAKTSGRVSEAVADRLAVRGLGRTVDEVYGYRLEEHTL